MKEWRTEETSCERDALITKERHVNRVWGFVFSVKAGGFLISSGVSSTWDFFLPEKKVFYILYSFTLSVLRPPFCSCQIHCGTFQERRGGASLYLSPPSFFLSALICCLPILSVLERDSTCCVHHEGPRSKDCAHMNTTYTQDKWFTFTWIHVALKFLNQHPASVTGSNRWKCLTEMSINTRQSWLTLINAHTHILALLHLKDLNGTM